MGYGRIPMRKLQELWRGHRLEGCGLPSTKSPPKSLAVRPVGRPVGERTFETRGKPLGDQLARVSEIRSAAERCPRGQGRGDCAVTFC